MSEKVYGFSSLNKCKREVYPTSQVYSKEEVDNIVPVIRYGTSDPDNTVGKDGDLYIKITE